MTELQRDRPACQISPSILSSDFARLKEECERMISLGADWLHVDVMDGHFVPNLTLGAPIVKALRKNLPEAFLDCHLMVSNPKQWVPDFAKAGASMYTFHIECLVDDGSNADQLKALEALIDEVKATGMKVGVALKPKTPADWILPFLPKLDMVLVLTVEPGFGGQKFMADVVGKCKVIRQASKEIDIQVDGGLSPSTVDAAAEVGANVIVAGSAIFGSDAPQEVIKTLRESVEKHATSPSN